MPANEQSVRDGGFVATQEYGVIPMRPSWGALSIGTFVFALFARPLMSALFGGRGALSLGLVMLSVPVAGLVGTLFGWLGVRYSRSKTVARLGLFLNATVFGLTALLALAFLYVRYWR